MTDYEIGFWGLVVAAVSLVATIVFGVLPLLRRRAAKGIEIRQDGREFLHADSVTQRLAATQSRRADLVKSLVIGGVSVAGAEAMHPHKHAPRKPTGDDNNSGASEGDGAGHTNLVDTSSIDDAGAALGGIGRFFRTVLDFFT